MKNILIVSKDFLPKIGGISIMMHHLGNAFEENQCNVTILAPPYAEVPGQKQKYRVVTGKNEDWHRDRWYTRVFKTNSFKKLLSETIERFHPDVVLIGDLADSGRYADACIWARQHYSLPLGIFCHGMDIRSQLVTKSNILYEMAGKILGPIAGIWTLRQLIYKLVWQSDYIFTNSHYTAGLVKRYVNRHAVVIGCGLSKEDWNRETRIIKGYDQYLKRQLRKKIGLGKEPMVAYVGRIVSRKNIVSLLKSLIYLQNVRLAVVGDGIMKSELQESAEKFDVQNRIIWYGLTSEKKKWKIIRAADVLCLPATEDKSGGVEGFGIVLLEASAAGTPVVVADSGGMTDIVENEKTGLLWDGKDVKNLAGQLQKLIYDTELAEYCVSNARRQIRERFLWQNVARKVLLELELK